MRRLLFLQFAVATTLGYWLWATYWASEDAGDWRQGQLVVILPPADSPDAQFSQKLAGMFAAQLGAKLKPLTIFPNEVIPSLSRHQAHLSAMGMRANEEDASLRFVTPYQTVREKVVCGSNPPRHPEDLTSRYLAVAAGSAQEAALRAAQQATPTLHWTTYERKLPYELLHEVGDGQIDCTVANEEQLAHMRNFHPDMTAAFDIAPPSRLAWAFAADADPELIQQAQDFFARIRKDGTLHRLLEQYYGYTERLMPVDASAFLTHMRTLLPHYRPLFEEAAAVTGIDWQLIAAVSYRESHWDPLATSFTNVRGIMMLTEETADQMGVENRLDPRQSIMAGARYLQLLKEQLPPHILDPDRTYLALAAYNQGRGHLEDARVLAQRRGLNPDLWVDVKKVMPQLKNPDLEDQFMFGNARGGEAVIFVETVRLYYEMLRRLPLDASHPSPPSLYSIITGAKGRL